MTDKITGDVRGQASDAPELSRPALLLHSCCAPCSSYVLEYLKPDYDITLFYFNPNISPEAEYRKRLSEQKRLLDAAHGGVALIEGVYDHELFRHTVRELEELPEGGERCVKCCALRINETARVAGERGYAFFTTTLSVSPHKNAAVLNELCGTAAAESGVKTFYADFKKKDGYKRSVELSREYGLYRQKYCGCSPDNRD